MYKWIMEAERIEKLQKRKQKFLEAIEITKKSKRQIIEFTQNLASLYNYGKISKQEYEEKISQGLKNRTAEQWLRYYDGYINYYKEQLVICEEQIKKIEVGSKKVTLILIILIVLVLTCLLISAFFILKPLGKDFLEKINEKISSVIKHAEAPEIGEIEEVGKVPALPSEVYEEPKVPVSLVDNQAKISEESLIQYRAVLGKAVKWKKQFKVEGISGFSLEIPKNSENIKINTIKDGKKEDITEIININEKREYWLFGEKSVEIGLTGKSITGNVVADNGKSITGNVVADNGKSITGNAVADNGKSITRKAIADNSDSISYEVEYETPAPEISELEAEGRAIKKVLIKGPDDVHYKNILSFTELPREFDKNELRRLKLYQIKDGQRIATEFIAYDTNENSLFDFIEWITPYLSEATFELVIEISKAEHLDSEKNFISDIYEQVKALDENWSEEIKSKEYVRVTFSKLLDNSRDITIYPRIVSGEPKIEVYEINGEEKIAEFQSLQSNEYNKVLLTNLTGEQDVFDLRIIDGNIEIEHIIDPTILVYQENANQTALVGSWTNGLRTYDKNWNSYGSCESGQTCYLYVNYTKSTGALNTSLWEVRDRNARVNLKINSTCWNYDSTKLILRAESKGAVANTVSWQCYNGIYWEALRTVISSSGPHSGIVYEERMIWNISIDTIPPKIKIISPLSQTYSSSIIDFNFSSDEPGYCEYTLNNGLTNYTMTANSSSTGFNATNSSIANGDYTVTAYCNDTAGNKNYTEKVSFSINTNQPPEITYVSEISLVTPIEASSKQITFYTTVYDSNGVGDINDSSVKANFTKSEVVRENNCIWLNDINLNSANYSCAIDLWYFDKAGTWNITLYAQDNSSASAQNISTTFQYNLLKAIVISPQEIIWPKLIQGAKNQTPNVPIIINNTGNFNATGEIAIQAVNLYGETDDTEFIDVGNFTADVDSGEEACDGFSLINNVNVTIITAILEAGNLSAGQAQEEIYYCIPEVPLVSSQNYSTKEAGSWEITVLIAALIIRKKKQKSKKLKNNLKEDNLIISLNLLTKELKQEFSEEKQKIIRILIKEIKKKYKLNNKELSEIIEIKKEIKIPLSIFSAKPGALEIVTKYLKENLNLRYKEISLLLQRNERTIWTAYHKAKEKQKTPLEIKEEKIFLPISIFNKKLTILESVVAYLKDKKLKYVEIAKLLNRNQRNIWVVYSKAVKKIKDNI